GLEVGGIEGGEKRVRGATEKESVQAAAIAGRAAVGAPFLLRLRDGIPARRLRRLPARPADRAVQEATGGESRVTDDFGFDPHALLPGQQQIPRVFVLEIRAEFARLPVGISA